MLQVLTQMRQPKWVQVPVLGPSRWFRTSHFDLWNGEHIGAGFVAIRCHGEIGHTHEGQK